MNARKQPKPKRRKKNKSRTQGTEFWSFPVLRHSADPAKVSSDSESDYEFQPDVQTPTSSPLTEIIKVPKGPRSDAEISAAFTQFYMQHATQEFAEDLDQMRNADDFKNETVGILVGALRQGVQGFGKEEKRRLVVAAGMKKAHHKSEEVNC